MAQNQEKKKENNFNFGMSFSNSQSSELDEQKLDKLVIDSKPENTKRSTGDTANLEDGWKKEI